MLLYLLQCPRKTWVSTLTFQNGVFPSNAFGGCYYKTDVLIALVHLGDISANCWPPGEGLIRTVVQQELRGRKAELLLGSRGRLQGWGRLVKRLRNARGVRASRAGFRNTAR